MLARPPSSALESNTCLKATVPILELKGLSKQFEFTGDRHRGAARRQPPRQQRRVRLPDRRLGLRQIHLAAHRRRASRRRRTASVLMWDRPIEGPAPEPWHGVPGLRPVSLAQRARQHQRSARRHAGRPKAEVKGTRSIASSNWSACSVSPTPIRISSRAA